MTFTIQHDDTGAVKSLDAPNGWTMAKVVEEGYKLLGETPKMGDRVEAGGKDLTPYLSLKVKEFVEQGIAPDLVISIAGPLGGASR